VTNVVRLLGPSSDEGVTPTEELAAILLSKLALEPEAHAHIARAGAIPVSGQSAVAPACDLHVLYANILSCVRVVDVCIALGMLSCMFR
jgi:hypothetical protein